MSGVYDRILKLTPADQCGDSYINVPYMAVLNLKDEGEIREFVETYKRLYPSDYQDTISFTLGYFERTDRELWNKAVGDLIGISLDLNRSEKKLCTQFTWINGDNKEIEFPNKPVQEQGKHQNIMNFGFINKKK